MCKIIRCVNSSNSDESSNMGLNYFHVTHEEIHNNSYIQRELQPIVLHVRQVKDTALYLSHIHEKINSYFYGKTTRVYKYSGSYVCMCLFCVFLRRYRSYQQNYLILSILHRFRWQVFFL